MQRLVLIRGLPGSGKSTLAKSMTDFVHVEADMFFERDGSYCFDASQLDEAHQYCFQRAREALQKGLNVVVSNTFVKLSEMEPYQALGVPTHVIEATGRFKNIHNVSESVIEEMMEKWEPLTANQEDARLDR